MLFIYFMFVLSTLMKKHERIFLFYVPKLKSKYLIFISDSHRVILLLSQYGLFFLHRFNVGLSFQFSFIFIKI